MTFSDLETDMRAWRHHLHQNPEFGFEEIKTADFVAEKLSDFGIKDIQTSIGNTGVVATLESNPGCFTGLEVVPVNLRPPAPIRSK